MGRNGKRGDYIMSELLLELFSEEIPANMQVMATRAFKDIFTQYFQSQNIIIENIEAYVTPRRLAIHVQGLPKLISSKVTEIKGPKTNAPSQAIDGFCLSNKIDKSELKVQEIKGVDYYIYEQVNAEQTIFALLKKDLPSLISSYTWPKSMYWGAHKIKWIRPLQNILCILDGEIIDFEYGHLKANNKSCGHRFMGDGFFEVENFKDYQIKLEKNFVILDQNIRKNYIKENLIKLASTKKLIWIEDEDLLNEVTGLVEYPQVLMGKINEKFTSLPSEVLITSMKIHQKYFSGCDQNGNFAPYFLFVANIKSADPDTVISGNEKVLSARLSDALYFYEQDKKNTLESQIEKLDKVIFHAKLGSLKDKVLRLEKIAEKFALGLGKAALLCKSDIISEMVGEFPNLQGIMGSYYALSEGLSEDIANAIRDHYKTHIEIDSNKSSYSAYLAIIDKVDSLCGLMIAGERASGSKDPYALRRYAISIIKLVDENDNVDQILDNYIDATLNAYGKNFDSKKEIIDFLKERLVYFYQDFYDKQIVMSVIYSAQTLEISMIKAKLKALTQFLETDAGKDLLDIYKRLRILKDIKNISDAVDKNLLKNSYEQKLYEAIKLLNINEIFNQPKEHSYVLALKSLIDLKNVIADFFENVMVKDKDEKIANNRLILLYQVKQIFDQIADFDRL
ncbi:MAG: glycine--tRNA ligase subunit beta [Rickettsiales bacterium]|nr:MAG: glycine--tRNA ligase subunit beta [Rickettsiales bacterium]